MKNTQCQYVFMTDSTMNDLHYENNKNIKKT